MFSLSLAESAGSAMGVLGSLLLASHTRWSPWGWVFFLMSNLCWIFYAVMSQAHGLLIQQIVFTGTSLLGVYRSLHPPKPSLEKTIHD